MGIKSLLLTYILFITSSCAMPKMWIVSEEDNGGVIAYQNYDDVKNEKWLDDFKKKTTCPDTFQMSEWRRQSKTVQKNMVMWKQPKSSTTKTTYTIKNPNSYGSNIKVEGNSTTKDSQGSMQVIPYSEEVQWIEQKYTCDRELTYKEECDQKINAVSCNFAAFEYKRNGDDKSKNNYFEKGCNLNNGAACYFRSEDLEGSLSKEYEVKACKFGYLSACENVSSKEIINAGINTAKKICFKDNEHHTCQSLGYFYESKLKSNQKAFYAFKHGCNISYKKNVPTLCISAAYFATLLGKKEQKKEVLEKACKVEPSEMHKKSIDYACAFYGALIRDKQKVVAHSGTLERECVIDERGGACYDMACLYSLLGDKKGSKDFLEKIKKLNDPKSLKRLKKQALKDPDLLHTFKKSEISAILK